MHVRSILEQNLARVRGRIDDARRATGSTARARLMAITKRDAPETARLACELGLEDLGENRLEGLSEKIDWFAAHAPDERPRWHYVGHVQRNKARRVALLADEIHSIDGLKLLTTLGRVCAEEGRRPRVYLQLKLTDETQKHGMDPQELEECVAALAELDALEAGGLMCMAAPAVDDASRAAALATFERLAELARAHADGPWAAGRPLLSMGMSADLEQAVAAGSDWLRIGTALFEGAALAEDGR